MPEPIIDGDFPKRVKPGETAMWSLESDGPKRIL